MKSNHIISTLFFFCLALLPQWISATYGGSFFSYTATNHDVPRVLPLVYKSPVYSYQYSALPSATHTSFQTFPSTPAVVPYQAVWPVTSYTTAFTKPTLPIKPVTFQDSVFTAPCVHGHQVNSLFEIVRPTASSYTPVKVKPNNTTEHVYKPVFTPIYSPFWTSYQPLFSYQGTIQHVPPPPPIDKTGSSEMMEKEEEPKEEKPKPESGSKKEAEAAKISEKEEAEAAASNKEPTTSSTTEAPAKEEESASIAAETEKSAMKKAKARRDLFSSKRFNSKKRM